MLKIPDLLVLLVVLAIGNASPLSPSEPLTRIAFGSCNEHHLPQPMWTPITQFDPELWIWLGDAVYADSHIGKLYRYPSSLEQMTRRFETQKQRPEYQTFLTTTKADVIGVWDDHDYGVNDGDWTYVNKSAAQQIYLDFVEEDANSPRRHQQGMYTSYVYGPQGKQVKIILLDIRYHQNEEPGDILGSEQWKWLANELQANTAQLTIIGSGLQVVSHGKWIGEGWKSFPKSRARLFQLLSKFNHNSAVFFLSGDVHFAEFSRSHYCAKVNDDDTRVVPLWDLTCSGLTHSWCHSYIPSFLNPFACDHIFPLTQHPVNTVGSLYGYLNFGALSVQWNDDDVKQSRFSAEIRNTQGEPVRRFEWTFAELSPSTFSAQKLQETPEVVKDCATESALAVSTPTEIGGIKFAVVVLATTATAMIGFSVVVVKVLSACFRRLFISPSKRTKKD